MSGSFSKALKHVLEHEGGFANHPHDPGGRTMYGVTQRVYNAYRARKKVAYRDVRKIQQDELKDIYRTMYWNVIQGDSLPAGPNLAWFDYAVNSGSVQATKSAQRALRKMGHKGLVVDGIVGPATLHAVETTSDYHELVNRICDRRLSFMQRIRNGRLWRTFGRGWSRRVRDIRRASLDMVLATPQQTRVPKPAPKELGEVGEKSAPKQTLWQWLIGLLGGGGAAGVVGAVNNPYALAAIAIVAITVIGYIIMTQSEVEA